MQPTNNTFATVPKHGFRGFGLLNREALRIRIRRDHDVWSETETIHLGASKLPSYETGIERSIQYEGDGRIPEDILGAPR